MELGAEAVVGAAQAYGFNRPVPFELPLLTSEIPDAESFENSPAALAQTALGERDVQATAFQMALVASAIANDGLLMEPHVIARFFDADSTLLSEVEPTLFAQPLGAGTATVLQQMMERVVTQGTATRAQIPGVRVAGKTGTAETLAGPPHVWFIGFAPIDNPSIAIAVIVANGGDFGESAAGGSVAAPIGRDVIDAWLTISGSRP
jgi:peptidoglycan glycosyltransferase